MAEDSIPKALWKEMKDIGKQRIGQILQVREEGEVMLPSPPLQHTINSQEPPPTPAPSEDRLFTDWSSIGSGSPPVIPPPQSVPVGDTLTTPGVEGIHGPLYMRLTKQPCNPPNLFLRNLIWALQVVQIKKIFLPP